MKTMHLHIFCTSLYVAFAGATAIQRRQSTDDPSDALAGLSIGDIINALGVGLVTGIQVNISLETLITNYVTVSVALKNPLPIELTIDRIVSSAGINETVYAEFDYTFPEPVVVPLFGSANTSVIPEVLLTKGAIASLDIIPAGYLDLINVDAYVRAGTILGHLGIPIPITGLEQAGVPTTYNLALT